MSQILIEYVRWNQLVVWQWNIKAGSLWRTSQNGCIGGVKCHFPNKWLENINKSQKTKLGSSLIELFMWMFHGICYHSFFFFLQELHTYITDLHNPKMLRTRNLIIETITFLPSDQYKDKQNNIIQHLWCEHKRISLKYMPQIYYMETLGTKQKIFFHQPLPSRSKNSAGPLKNISWSSSN